MRLIPVCIMLAGCATPPTFDTASRDPVCARQCLTGYSACASGAGNTFNRMISADILAACQATTTACLTTCPAK